MGSTSRVIYHNGMAPFAAVNNDNNNIIIIIIMIMIYGLIFKAVGPSSGKLSSVLI